MGPSNPTVRSSILHTVHGAPSSPRASAGAPPAVTPPWDTTPRHRHSLRLGDRDCAVVALNNAVGEPRFNRADMAKFQPAFDDRDMPVKFLVRAISVGKSPYAGTVCKKLTETYTPVES
jgi:hypothetical protein